MTESLTTILPLELPAFVSKKKQNSVSADLKNILQSLKRIEKKIDESCPSCIDFTTKKPNRCYQQETFLFWQISLHLILQ
jgi:hypothetical protein